jgi:hypothetical protein
VTRPPFDAGEIGRLTPGLTVRRSHRPVAEEDKLTLLAADARPARRGRAPQAVLRFGARVRRW